jgi:hypothetical protein
VAEEWYDGHAWNMRCERAPVNTLMGKQTPALGPRMPAAPNLPR